MCIKRCPTCGSTWLETDLNFNFLCGLGLLLLFLCYLKGIPFPPWKTKPTQKRQGRAKRRRKRGTLKDYRCYQREVEKTQKLISVLRSAFGRHHDTIQFCQLLCPDPSCEVCNSTTAEIHQLLFPKSLENFTPLASTAPGTSSFTLSPDSSAVPPGDLTSASLPEPCPPHASIFSPNPVSPLTDFFPPSPLGDSLPPEPFPPLDSQFPVDHFPPPLRAFPPIPPHDSQTVDPVPTEATLSLNTIFSLDPTVSSNVSPLPELFQTVNPTEMFACHQAPPTPFPSPPPDSGVTVTQSKSISISMKPVPESSPPESSGGVSPYAPKITGLGSSSLSIVDFPWWQPRANDFFPSTLAPRDFCQEFWALHSSEASSKGDPAANLVEPGNLSLLSPDVLALREKQVQKRSDFPMWKEMEKVSFPTVADKHDLASSLSFWSSKDQSKELHMHQQPPPYPTTLEEGHLQKTLIQLFWSLPTLHSESLFSAAHVSDNCSFLFIFNRISNASTEQESQVVLHSLPLSLPENQPQPFLHAQAHLQSPFPILPSGSIPLIKIYGVCFHTPQNESECLMSNEKQCQEWNVLQKEQECVWGLPVAVQRSQEDFCPSAPNPCVNHWASQAHVPISIPPGQFPLSDELQRKLESHLRKRLIQHYLGTPCRIYESLKMISHVSIPSELPEWQWHCGCSLISKSQSKVKQSESFNEEELEMLQLEHDDLEKDKDDLEKDNDDLEKDKDDLEKDNDDMEKDNNDLENGQGHNLGNGLKAYLLSDPGSSSDNYMVYDSEKEPRSQSEENSMGSVKTIGQQQFENVLEIHLSKKSEEINESQLPGTVQESWHAMKQTLLLSEKSHTEIKQRSLPPSEVEDYSLNAIWELVSVESRAQQILQAHTERFPMRMRLDLLPRVLESTELFKLIEATSHSNFSSSNNQKDVQKMKDGRQTLPVKRDTIGNTCSPKPPRRHAGVRHEPKDDNANSSGRGGRQQGEKRKNPEPIVPTVSREIFRAKELGMHRSLSSILTTNKAVSSQVIKGNEHQVKTTVPPNISFPQAPTLSAHTEQLFYEIKLMLENTEHSPEPIVPTVSREIFRAKELDVHQSQSSVLTTSKAVSSQVIKGNEHQVKTRVPPNISVPQAPTLSARTEQLFYELKLMLENTEHSWDQLKCTGLPPASDRLTYKASLTHAQGVSNGNSGASQVLAVHPEDTGMTMEQQQEPCFPKHVLRKCQSKNPLPAAMTMSPPDSKAHELGGGHARLRTCQPRRNSFSTEDMALKKRFPSQDVALKVKLGSKPSQTLSQTGQLPLDSTSQKGQSPPKSLFRKKVKHFLQCLTPGTESKRQENSQEKHSPPTSVETRGLLEGRNAFTGMTEAQKFLTDGGKLLEEKMGRRHAIDSTCPQQSISSPAKSGKTRQKAQVQAQAQPVWGLAFQLQGSVLQGDKYQAPPARSCLCWPRPNRKH